MIVNKALLTSETFSVKSVVLIKHCVEEMLGNDQVYVKADVLARSTIQLAPPSEENSILVFPVVPHLAKVIVWVEQPTSASPPFGKVTFVNTLEIEKTTLLKSKFAG